MPEIELGRDTPAPRSLAYSAGWDAGNASMRKAGRKRWSVDDYNAAAREQNRILDACGVP